MTLSQYNAWKADGRPFRLMTPADDLQTVLQRHGYTVYDIGNESHMLANPAEDHTPFSKTGWPGTAKYGIGYAIDIMPPKAGARSKLDGKPLPTLQQLGAQIVKDRKANVSGILWLKYINWEPERDNGGPCYQESWKPNHARRSSSDRGHIHMSGRTGLESSTAARGYDPVARIRGVSDLTPEEHQWLKDIRYATVQLDGRTPVGMAYLRMTVGQDHADGSTPAKHPTLVSLAAGIAGARTEITALRSVVEALAKTIANAGGSVDTAAILAGVDRAVDRAAKETQTELRDAVADLGEGGALQVRADQA